VLCAIVAALKDGDGRITVPGFYDRVRALSTAEREEFRRVPFDEKGFLEAAGAPEPFGERGFTTLERSTARPTLDVNGMWSGYIGEGAKTVLPALAHAKVSMRLVPDQDPDELFPRFEAYVKKLAPRTVTVTVSNHHGATPFLTDPHHPMLEAARRALARVWTKAPALIREGGSIPVMTTFQRTHGVPCILMGFGLDDDQVHAPNEKFSLSSYFGGTKSVAFLYEELARA
jgi:acetylornithine deacetylase/succinyl-diaminopimelate desuccinylase-like protein